jgi:hypothetical protein
VDLGGPGSNLDVMPTAPRRAPGLDPRAPAPVPAPAGMGRPGAPQPAMGRSPSMQPQPQPQPLPQPWRAPSGGRKKPSLIRPWMVIAVILVLAGILAIVVAMSGPDVPAAQGTNPPPAGGARPPAEGARPPAEGAR